jgi:adenylate cyclase
MVSAADILNARILVVDDKEANVRLLEGMLRVAGYASIESTTDPNRVCELHRKNRYSLIMLDLQMPGMDGFQVMEGLKEIEEDGYLPVLVITAQPDHKLRALQAGAKDFVSKPFDMAELRARVHNILEVRLLHLEAKNYGKEEKRRVDELEQVLNQLRQTQDRMVVQEKLASLGALTSGIAHEIKNPLNFVTNFAKASRELVTEIREHVATGTGSESVLELLGQLEQYILKIDEHGVRANRIVRGMLIRGSEQITASSEIV